MRVTREYLQYSSTDTRMRRSHRNDTRRSTVGYIDVWSIQRRFQGSSTDHGHLQSIHFVFLISFQAFDVLGSLFHHLPNVLSAALLRDLTYSKGTLVHLVMFLSYAFAVCFHPVPGNPSGRYLGAGIRSTAYVLDTKACENSSITRSKKSTR